MTVTVVPAAGPAADRYPPGVQGSSFPPNTRNGASPTETIAPSGSDDSRAVYDRRTPGRTSRSECIRASISATPGTPPPGNRPGPLERPVVLVAALAARPVPGRQPGSLVEEEQLGKPSRRPQFPPSASKRQHADGPGPAARVTHQPALAVVQ